MNIKNDPLYNQNCDAEFLCQLQLCKEGVHCNMYLEDIALDGLKKSNKIMLKVEAKFKCNSVESFEFGKKAKAHPVMFGSEENKSFAKHTPSGSLEITIDNETEAADFFQPGVEFYVTFSTSKSD